MTNYSNDVNNAHYLVTSQERPLHLDNLLLYTFNIVCLKIRYRTAVTRNLV